MIRARIGKNYMVLVSQYPVAPAGSRCIARYKINITDKAGESQMDPEWVGVNGATYRSVLSFEDPDVIDKFAELFSLRRRA